MFFCLQKESAHSSFPPSYATIWAKGGGDAVKYIKQPKRHIVLDDFEWRALVKGINEYRKQVIDEDGCVEVMNELLIKIISIIILCLCYRLLREQPGFCV